MKTVASHLKDHHATSARFHEGASADLAQLAKHFGDAAAAVKDNAPLSRAYAGLSNAASRLSTRHKAHGDYHAAQAEESQAAEKAVRVRDENDLSKIAPDGIRKFAFTPPSGVRAIPRAGQQPLNDVTEVDADFEEFLKVS